MTASPLPTARPRGLPPAGPRTRRRRRPAAARRVIAVVFVLPALLLLGALVVYPVLFSVGRSLFDASGDTLRRRRATTPRCSATRPPSRPSATAPIWVVVAPALLTGLGLILAVLTEKVRWATAFKLLLFMPMAVSFLAAGIIFRLAYEQDPDKGVLNAVVVGVHDAFQGTVVLPDRPRPRRPGTGQGARTARTAPTAHASRPGDAVTLGLVGVAPDGPARRTPARARGRRAAGRRRRAARRGLPRLHPRRGRQSRARSTAGERAAGDDGRGGAGRQGGRHRPPPRPTAPSAFPGLDAGSYTVRLPGDELRRALRGRLLARPGAGHPGDHRRLSVDLDRLRDGPDRRRARGAAARRAGGGPDGRRERVAGLPPDHRAAARRPS